MLWAEEKMSFVKDKEASLLHKIKTTFILILLNNLFLVKLSHQEAFT